MAARRSNKGKQPPLPGVPVRGSDSGRPIMALLDLLGRRWALRLIWELRGGEALVFRELQARCGGLSPSVLNTRLAELRQARLVLAGADGYALTALGRELLELFGPVDRWAGQWARALGAADGAPPSQAGAKPRR